MQLGFTKEQALKVLKVGAWIAVSAFIDYLISQTTDMQFGVLHRSLTLFLLLSNSL
jgi:hypothetical protein